MGSTVVDGIETFGMNIMAESQSGSDEASRIARSDPCP
jgi:hypothetical protein